jgi:hypothetical protein
MAAFFQKLVSWPFILAGLALGVLAAMPFSQMGAYSGLVSIGLLTLLCFVPLTSSIIAIRNRRPAALILLIATPLLGICGQ